MPAVLILWFLIIVVLIIGVTVFAGVASFKLFKWMSGGGSGRMPNYTREALRDAKKYAKLIKTTARECPAGPMRDRLNRTVEPVDDWLLNLKRLEQSLGKLYVQRNLDRELRKANFEIEQLRRQLLQATSATEVSSLRALMKSKKMHVSSLTELQAFQNHAELKIRKIASDLGATHAEMLLVTTRGDFSESRFQRLDENLQDNMAGLRDILSAMDDMRYMSGAASH
jgi:predicted RNase H-like nuclease (RuvC/YqgF family)